MHEHLILEVTTERGEFTQQRYEAVWAPHTGRVVTSVFFRWSLDVRDQDILAFLIAGGRPHHLTPPNYRIYWGHNASSTAPLASLFKPPHFRDFETLTLLPSPLPIPGSFEVRLEGTPIVVEARFGFQIWISTS
jgi:hypothetical protein